MHFALFISAAVLLSSTATAIPNNLKEGETSSVSENWRDHHEHVQSTSIYSPSRQFSTGSLTRYSNHTSTLSPNSTLSTSSLATRLGDHHCHHHSVTPNPSTTCIFTCPATTITITSICMITSITYVPNTSTLYATDSSGRQNLPSSSSYTSRFSTSVVDMRNSSSIVSTSFSGSLRPDSSREHGHHHNHHEKMTLSVVPLIAPSSPGLSIGAVTTSVFNTGHHHNHHNHNISSNVTITFIHPPRSSPSVHSLSTTYPNPVTTLLRSSWNTTHSSPSLSSPLSTPLTTHVTLTTIPKSSYTLVATPFSIASGTDLHPTTSIIPTTTVTGTPPSATAVNPEAVHCGLHGLPVGDYFLARFVQENEKVPLTVGTCYMYCTGIYGVDMGCQSYEFYDEEGTDAPRCDLYGGSVAQSLDSVNSYVPNVWYDVLCGPPN